jgi:hypothetical protein
MKFQRESELAAYIVINNFKLFGQVSMNHDEYQDLVSVARMRIKNMVIRTSARADLFIALALVQIAIRRYNEGSYWPCVKKELQLPELNASKQTYVGKVFLKTIRSYNLFILPSSPDDNQKYVENIKAHAFVTNNYMDGFFDFAYDYYETNLFRQIDENIAEDISYLSAFMSSSLSDEKNIITSDGEDLKKAPKAYRLLMSTRRVFADCDNDILVELFLPVLKMIDTYYFQEILPDADSGRFEGGFSIWCAKKKKQDEQFSSRSVHRRLHSVKPYILVYEGSEQSYIVIPPQKFRYDDCDGTVSVRVSSKTNSVQRELAVYKSFGVYLTLEEQIPIDDIFDSYTIEVRANTVKTHKINAKDYRIFNRHWESIDKFKKRTNILLAKHSTQIKWQNPRDVIDSYDGYKNWQYYQVEISDGSVCFINGNPVSIVGEFAKQPVFEGRLDNYRIIDERDRYLVASSTHPYISFAVDKRKMPGTTVIINGKKYAVDQIEAKACYDMPEQRSQIAVTLLLDDMLPHKDGKYTVSVDIPGETVKKLCEYFLLNTFSCKFDRYRYIYSNQAKLTVKKGDFLVECENDECSIEYENTRRIIYNVNLSGTLKDIILKVTSDSESFRFIIQINLFKYGFDIDEFRIDNNIIWYSDVGNILYLYMPHTRRIRIFSMDIDVDDVYGELVEDSLYKVDISAFANVIRSDPEIKSWNLTVAYYGASDQPSFFDLPRIVNTLEVQPYFILRNDEGTAFFETKIQGKAKLYLDVMKHLDDEKIVDHREIVSGMNAFPELSTDEYYDLFPVMEEEDEFGFECVKREMLPVTKASCVDFDNLENCRLPIRTIVYKERRLALSVKYFVKLITKTGDNMYEGGLTYKLPTARTKLIARVRAFVYFNADQMCLSLKIITGKAMKSIDPFYDKVTKRLSPKHYSDDSILGYRMNEKLDEAETIYIIDKDRIRRV